MSNITLPYDVNNGDALDADKIMANEDAIVSEYNSTVGGLTGDILTTSNTKTITNKTFTSPKINEDVALTSSSTELNLLDGVTALVTTSTTDTFTNKRITKRVGTEATNTASAPTSDTVDIWTVTALASANTFGVPTGTPTDGQTLIIRIKDNGTARALDFNAIYRFSSDLPKPTTTILGKTLYMGFIYNTADSRWDCLAIQNNY